MKEPRQKKLAERNAKHEALTRELRAKRILTEEKGQLAQLLEQEKTRAQERSELPAQCDGKREDHLETNNPKFNVLIE